MKVTKRWIWAVGVLVAAVVVVVVFRSRGEDQVTVRLVDRDTRSPLKCALTLEEYRYGLPLPLPLQFLRRCFPSVFEQSKRIRELNLTNGVFRVSRAVTKPSGRIVKFCLINFKGEGNTHLMIKYSASTNNQGVLTGTYASQWDYVKPGQTEIVVGVKMAAVAGR